MRPMHLQTSNLLIPLYSSFILLFSVGIHNGVVSEPQTHLLKSECNPYFIFNVFQDSNVTVFNQNLNATFREIGEQISVQNKHFATSQHDNGGNPTATLFQCRNYLSAADCAACFDAATEPILRCPTGTSGAHVVYDGCFLRFDISTTFFGETTQSLNVTSCGNQTTEGEAIITTFTSAAQQMLMNLQRETPRTGGFSVATKTQVPANNNGETIYGYAQCIETISQSNCEDCLKAQYNNMQTCLTSSDGRAYANGCFLRYSTSSFFPDNQTIDITPLKKQGSSNKGIIIGGVVAGVSLALIFIALFAFIIRRRKNHKITIVLRGDIPGASKLKGPVTFSYNVLKTATKNFSEANKIGEGGFGAVYKGTLRNGELVAIKKLNLRHSNKIDEEYESEVKLISNVHHRNLVRLLGCCSKGHERILVYEYMKNNSLDKYLYGEKKGYLDWKQRYEVILGVARGLTYLHEEFHVRIIHRDIKTNNILLDDDLQPRIADFGLARLIPEDKTHLSTRFAGTLGYTPLEYAIHGQLSEKVDIYSYGIVVLEIISGQNCNKLNVDGDDEGEYLLQRAWKLYERGMHLELVDNALDLKDYDAEEIKRIIEIALLCTQPSAETRPTMSEIMVLLKKKGLLENMRPTMPIFIETN